jgi:hypothetical protein
MQISDRRAHIGDALRSKSPPVDGLNSCPDPRPSTMESLLFNVSVEEKEAPPEPPSLEPFEFVLGRDRGGHWIVQETHGLCGGVFASKDAAISYAKFESADRRSVIRIARDPIELMVLTDR